MRERLPVTGQSRTGFLARTEQDYSPRPRDLWICWREMAARLCIKRRLAHESFAVRDLAISLDSARAKIVDEDGIVVKGIATHHSDCPSVAYRISYGACRWFSLETWMHPR